MITARPIALSAIFLILTAFLVVTPVMVHADPGDCPPGPNGEITLCNPLGQGSTIPDVLKRIFGEITLILSFIVPIIIIVGAFQMMFAAGNPEKFATGQKTIIYAIIGYVVVLMANGIIAIVKEILTP
jgi:hypothetical protein